MNTTRRTNPLLDWPQVKVKQKVTVEWHDGVLLKLNERQAMTTNGKVLNINNADDGFRAA